MKPIIIVAGVPQSYTSIISKFLLDNGGYNNDLMGKPNEVLDYKRFESESLEEYVKKRRLLKKGDLTDFFKSLPENKIIILKLPFILQFINELDQFTARPIKLVFAQRNPQDVILSSMEKSEKNKNKKEFIYYFERIVWYYKFATSCKFPTYSLLSEKLLQADNYTAKSLLNFCELNTKDIKFDSIDPKRIKNKNPSYIKYRFANFLWKRLSMFFRMYDK